MKRTAVSIILAIAALAMLAALVVQSRSLPLEVHLSQSAMSSELERSSDDFAALVATLQAAHREQRDPADESAARLAGVLAAPAALRRLADAIPAGSAERARLDMSLANFANAVASIESLAGEAIADQRVFARNVELVRDRGPEIIQHMRDLRLDEEAGQVFQLVVGALDHASPNATVSAGELTRLAAALTQDPRINANVPRELDQLRGAVVAIVDRKAPIGRRLGQLADVPLSQRSVAVASAAQDAYRRAVAAVEQARLMLSIYSAALFLVVGFAAFRLQASYRALNRSHSELEQLNESLEQRVTERTRKLADALKDLKESQVQLVQAEKMSSLGQLVAGISHEINTPLLYLSNNAVMIQERIELLNRFLGRCSAAFALKPEDGEARNAFQARFVAALKEVKRSLQHDDLEANVQEAQDLTQDSIEGLADLTEIAQSLKDFSRLDRAPTAKFDVNSGLEKTLTIARNLIKHKAEVHKFYGEVPEIECSPSQINQVFLNLLTNAAQAITEHGEIVITTKRHDDAHVEVSISDTGSGIPAEIIDKIRDPFFTTKDVGSGTGLGLSIVEEIVRAHGGRLEIESEVGRGSVFTVVLPIRQGPNSGVRGGESGWEGDEPVLDELSDWAEAV